MILSERAIRLLLDRLKWEPLFENDRLVLAEKRRSGYSDNTEVAQIEAALSIMLEAKVRAKGATR